MKTIKVKPSKIQNGDLLPFSEFEVCSVEWDNDPFSPCIESKAVHAEGGIYYPPVKQLIVRLKNGVMWITSDEYEIEIRRKD